MSQWHGTRAERLQQLVGEAKSDPMAKRQLESFIYRELQRLTTSYMQRQRFRPMVEVTELVHDALTEMSGPWLAFEDQPEFYAMAARIMRSVLVDQAQARRADKRSERYVVSFTDDFSTRGEDELLAIDVCLEQLQQESPDSANAIELHYFAGLSVADTARMMETSSSIVKQHIRFAKAWFMIKLPAARRSLQ